MKYTQTERGEQMKLTKAEKRWIKMKIVVCNLLSGEYYMILRYMINFRDKKSGDCFNAKIICRHTYRYVMTCTRGFIKLGKILKWDNMHPKKLLSLNNL